MYYEALLWNINSIYKVQGIHFQILHESLTQFTLYTELHLNTHTTLNTLMQLSCENNPLVKK